MNLYDMFGSKHLNENGISGEYYQGNGVSATIGSDNNASPIGSGTNEDQYGGGFGGGSGAPVTDTTSPIHGVDENEADYGPEYQDTVKKAGEHAKSLSKGHKTVWVPNPHGTGGRYKVVPKDNDLGQLASYLQQKGTEEVEEHIGKVAGGYRLYSHKGKNLGTYPSKAGAEKRERQVNAFDHMKEDSEISSPASRELVRTARRSNPEAMTDQDAVFGYLNNVAKRTQDNYKQVNNILKQLDPLNTELHQAEKELQDVETVNRQQQDVLRGLSNRLDQVRTQNLPSQQRAKAPEKSTAKDSTVSKEIDAINKKLDKQQHQHQQPAQQVQQQPADNSQAIANLQGQIASIQKMLDKMPGSFGDQTAEAAKLRVKQQNLINQLRSAQATTAQKMTPGLAKELLHDPEDMQQNLPFNEDEIMESRLYAMKRAGYDIL